jgi:ribonuclease Z
MRQIVGGLVAAVLSACASAPPPESVSTVAPMPPPPIPAAFSDVFDGKGLHVILCGTASPLPDPGRAQACTVVVAGDKAYVIDTGSRSWGQLARMQFPAARIAGIFLTHYHSDHIGDLGEFRMQTMVAGRNAMLPVYGPHGLKPVVDGFNLAYGEDAAYRLAHHGPAVINLAASPLVAKEFGASFKGELTAEEVVFQEDDLKVTAFEVDHDPIRPAVGYRFDWKGRSVVISGDTAWSQNLIDNAKGADVLVAESLAANMIVMASQQQAGQGNQRIAKVLGDIPDYHVTPVETAKMANEAGTKLLVYTHHVPSAQITMPAYFAGVAAVRPADQWVAGWDGLRVDLPVGSSEIRQGQLLPKP